MIRDDRGQSFEIDVVEVAGRLIRRLAAWDRRHLEENVVAARFTPEGGDVDETAELPRRRQADRARVVGPVIGKRERGWAEAIAQSPDDLGDRSILRVTVRPR